MQKRELLGRFREFCAGLSKTDRVAIVHHGDADGFCSAIISAKAVEKITGNRVAAVCPYEYGDKKQGRLAASAITKKKCNKVLVLDIGIDSAPHSMADKFRFEQCLVIDHHKMRKDLNSADTVFLKAEFFTKKDPSSYVTSKFAFDLFNSFVDVSELDWAACVGIIGDMNLRNWKPFARETIKKRKISLTQLYQLTEMIAAVEVEAAGKLPELFWLFYNTKSPAEILGSKFRAHLESFKKEKAVLVEGFEEKAEKFPQLELFFYAIKAKRENIKSYVVNEISEMHPGSNVILLHYIGHGRVRFSGRRQDFKVKMNDLLIEAVKGIPDSTAGGHVPAAAGSIPRAYVSKFKQNVISILEKKYAMQKSR